jgi:hypothetical protein
VSAEVGRQMGGWGAADSADNFVVRIHLPPEAVGLWILNLEDVVACEHGL